MDGHQQCLLSLYLVGTACTQRKIGGGSFDLQLYQNFPPYFLLTPIFHWTNYTINKTFSLEGKETQNGGENELEIGGTSAQDWGKLHLILIPDFGG